MQKVSEYKLYELAIAIHPLTDLAAPVMYKDVWISWYSARNVLSAIFQQRQLDFCLDAANKLFQAITAVVPQQWNDGAAKMKELKATTEPGADPADPEVPYYQIFNIIEAAKEFETVLKTELNNADTYFIDPKGTHKTSILLTQASREIPADALKDVPPQVVEDFNQAGRCMLFDNSTAVGFHLMRAVESAIYAYLRKLSGKDIPVKSRNWGAYVKALQKCSGDVKVISVIEHIKDNYRNPILHPEITLSADDAQVLFGLSVSAIVLIVTAMKGSKGATIAFPVAGAIAVP
ncbi:MAG TPA: hypothetical protein VKW06_05495 [Candidatus Angelobacter sp.]|nr:hypothetical protein [Candidatus Angelobacter sp.]